MRNGYWYGLMAALMAALAVALTVHAADAEKEVSLSMAAGESSATIVNTDTAWNWHVLDVYGRLGTNSLVDTYALTRGSVVIDSVTVTSNYNLTIDCDGSNILIPGATGTVERTAASTNTTFSGIAVIYKSKIFD